MSFKERDGLLISVISPVYKAENIVDELILRLIENLEKTTPDFEIILVEDGSPDNSWNKISECCAKDKRVKGIKLSRNFGQHYAISAGLSFAKAEWIIVIDCDLQDRPDQIGILYEKAVSGYDVVVGRRHDRKDRFMKKTVSLAFHEVLSFLTGTKFDRTVANFGIYNKKVISVILGMKESIRYFPTMVKWVGFKSVAIDIKHSERYEGESSYNFGKLLNLSLDIILAYSDKPLRIMVKLGLTISFFSFLLGIYVLVRWYLVGLNVIGYAGLITSIWFIGGVIISMLGILGLYTGKIFEGVKSRPLFIVSETLNE